MALFNYATKEITLKIVYYGPGLSGKTTNLQYLHSVLNPETKGKLLSLSTEADRTLFFDFLPVELGKIKDFSIRFQLYTVPGQVRYNATRRVVLKGADAVVFVADSQKAMRQQNIDSLDNMRENLTANNINPDTVPVLLQFNKRDLDNIMSLDDLNQDLNPDNRFTTMESVAVNGSGVDESFKLITKMLLKDIAKKHKIEVQPPVSARPTEEPAAPSETAKPEIPSLKMPAPSSVLPPVEEPFAGVVVEEEIEPFYELEEEAAELSMPPSEAERLTSPVFGEESPAHDIFETTEPPLRQPSALEPSDIFPDRESITPSFDFSKEAAPAEPVIPATPLPEKVIEKQEAFEEEIVIPPPPSRKVEAEKIEEPLDEIVSEALPATAYDSGRLDELAADMRRLSVTLAGIANALSQVKNQVSTMAKDLSATQQSVRELKPSEAGQQEPRPSQTDQAALKELKVIRLEQQTIVSDLREIQNLLNGIRQKKSWFRF